MYMQEQDMRIKIREFIELNMNVDDVFELKDGDNIFVKGYVNSIFAMRLLTFIEKFSGVTVMDEDIVLANFSSINAMVALTRKHAGVN